MSSMSGATSATIAATASAATAAQTRPTKGYRSLTGTTTTANSAAVRCSTAVFAAWMRACSSWVSVAPMSPAPRGAAATEGSAATGEASAPAAAAEPTAAEAADVGAGNAPVTRTAVTPHQQHQEKHDEDEIDPERRDRQRRAPLLLCRRRRGSGIAAEHAKEHGCAREHAAVQIAALEGRQDIALDDRPGERVRERALEAIADLDPHLALVGRHDQQRAGVLVLLADAPVAAELIAEILDRQTLERLQRHHHDLLAAAGALVLRQHFREPAPGRGREHAGLVDHAARERGKIRLGRARDADDREQQDQRYCAKCTRRRVHKHAHFARVRTQRNASPLLVRPSTRA